MSNGYLIQTITCVILALHCSEIAASSLKKRNNAYTIYRKQTLLGSAHHGGTALFEPQESASAPDHEISSSGGTGDGDAVNGKYDDGFYDYKISSEASGPSSQYPLTSDSNHGSHKAGYSIGSGLRSIAQGSANQAYSAVASQHAAAKQAAFLAKNTLAQAAVQAAQTAQAALEGKQVLLEELQQQATNAQRALSRELEQLKAAKITAQLAKQTAQAAHNHVSVLTAAVNNAKAVAEHADQASQEVSNQLASQSSMVGQAKTRLEQVEEQLKQASIDFEATKEATLKASSSAAEAQVNASKAAAHATLGLHESAQQNHSANESYEDAQPLGHQVHSSHSEHSSIDRRERKH